MHLLFSRPFASFAGHISKESDQFKGQVEKLKAVDAKLQQKMVQMCYFKNWEDPDTKVSVTMGMSNQFEALNFYTSPDPYGFENTNNYFIITEVIKENIDAKSLSVEKQNAILNLFNHNTAITSVQFVPVQGKESEGVVDLVALWSRTCVAGTSKDELASVLNQFHTNVQVWTKQVDSVLKSSDSLKPDATQEASADKSHDRALVSALKQTTKATGDTPKLLYNNQKTFAKAVAQHVKHWKAVYDSESKGYYPSRCGLLANPIYASQMAPEYQSNPQRNTARVGWDSSHPDMLQVRAYTASALSNPFFFPLSVTIKDLTQIYPKYLEKLKSAVSSSAIFDGVRMSGANQQNDNKFWMSNYNTIMPYSWYYETYRNVALEKGLDEVNLLVGLCETVRSFVPTLPHFKVPVDASTSKKTEIECAATAQAQAVSASVNEFATSFIELYNEFIASIEKLGGYNLIPKGWNTQVFNFDMYDYDHNKVRMVTYNYVGITTPYPYCWPEITRTLVRPIDYATFTQEEKDKLQSFLAAFNSQNNGWTIQMMESQAEDASLMNTVRFDLYYKSNSLSGDNSTDAMYLERSLTNFNTQFPEIQKQLLAALPSNAKASVEDLDTNFAVIKKPLQTSKDTGIAALAKAFNTIQLPMNSKASFAIMHGKSSEGRSYSLSYSTGADQYQLRGTLLNPVPFTGMSKKIQDSMRKFCAAHPKLNMSLVNNYGQLSTGFSVPADTSMVAQRYVDTYASDHSIMKKVKRFKKELDAVKFD